MKPQDCACGSNCAPNEGCRSAGPLKSDLFEALGWTFETFHTAKCRTHLEDPGNVCVCRPPAVAEVVR